MSEHIQAVERFARPTELRILHVVSFEDAAFFREQIDELESRGITCDVVAGVPSDDGSERDGKFGLLSSLLKRFTPPSGHNVRFYAYNASRCYPKLLSTTLQNEYDLIHVNSGLMAPFGLLQPQKPVFISFWGSDLLGGYMGGLFPHVSKLCARFSHANIVMSQEMADELNGTDCYVIPHGVDTDKFRPMDRETAIERVGWNEEQRNVLFPYNPKREEKNVDMARAVVAEVNERMDTDVSLQVVYTVPHEEMPFYMNGADLMLVTSDHEGFPNTVKEALACNLPIVSRDVGDVEMRLRAVENTYVCTSFEELVDRTEAVLRSNRRSDGRSHIRDLGKEHMGERLLEVYDDVVSEYRR